MKLELKHLAPYLPYNLNLDTKGYLWEFVLTPVELDIDYFNEKGWKPILRPLSDLTKDEYHFIWENETDVESIESLLELDKESLLTSKLSYDFWQMLFENHFDVFSLIEEGLAIDINTLIND